VPRQRTPASKATRPALDRGPTLSATGPRGSPTIPGSLDEEVVLEPGDGGKRMEEQPPAGSGRVKALGQGIDSNLAH